MKSIFSRLLFSFLVIILVTIMSIGIFFPSLLRNYLMEQKETELKNKGNQIVDLSRQFLNNNIDEITFSYILNSIDEVVDSRTLIIDRSAIIKNSPFRFRNMPVPPKLKQGMQFDDNDLDQIFKGTTVTKSGYNSNFKETMITVGIPVYNENGSVVIGAIILNSPITGITEVTNRTILMLIFACIAGLVFSLVTAYFLSLTLSKPIRTISKAAVQIADGDYSKKVDIKRKDEIGSLATSFNYLTDKLNDTIGDLNNEKSKLSDILHSMEEGLIAVDNGLNIIHINAAALSLMDMDKMPSILSDIISGSDILSSAKDVLGNGKSKSCQYNMSEDKVLSILISPLKYNSGEIYGAIVLLHDVSESVKLENMRRDFVANVSHELRTPLTSIRGFIEPLIDGTVTDEETTQKYHNIIRNETIRLEKLINELLDLSRLQAGKIELQIEKIDIVELIKNVSTRFIPTLNSKNIQFAFNNPGKPVNVFADGDRLVQLIIIFIDNAIKYTPEGGKVEVGVKEDGEIVRVSIKDNGIGIPEKDIPYIWERFYKVDKSRTGKNSGTGLGLSIAKNIIELHHQTVSVESKPGEGTRFEFTLKRSI